MAKLESAHLLSQRSAWLRRIAALVLCAGAALSSPAASAFSGSADGIQGGGEDVTFTITITVIGAGSVTVRSEAAADCVPIAGGTSCLDGAVVTLTPVPAANHVFFAWQGDDACSDHSLIVSQDVGCTAVFTTALGASPTGQGWSQLGDALTTGGEVDPAPSLALDGDHPVVAYVEAIGSDIARLFVKRLEGTSFVALGGGALNSTSTTAASEPSLVSSPGGLPYFLAFIQGNGAQQNLYVVAFDGSGWANVEMNGGQLNFVKGSKASSPSLVLDAAGRLMVAWIEDGVVKFKRFDGRTWLTATGGEGPPGTTGSDRVRLALDPTGAPVLAWRQAGGTGALLKVVQGDNFAILGTQVNPAGAELPFFEVHAGTGGPYIAFSETDKPFTLLAQRWNGAAWVSTTSGLTSVIVDRPSDRLLSIAHARTGLQVVYSSQSNSVDSAEIGVLGGPPSWSPGPLLSSTKASQIQSVSLEMVSQTSPMVAGVQRDAAGRYEARVWRYVP